MVVEMKEVLRLNPNHADALNYLGYSYADRESISRRPSPWSERPWN